MNNALHENSFMDPAHLKGVRGGAGGFTYNRIKREWAFVQKHPSFSTVYINCLLKILYAEKYAETTIRSACHKYENERICAQTENLYRP